MVLEILAQALDVTGQINPSMALAELDKWVLSGISGITGVVGFLIWNQIKDIKGSLKEMADSIKDISDLVHLHDKDIAVMKFKLSEGQ